jgi:cellulose biosynthesis protein BcsQ
MIIAFHNFKGGVGTTTLAAHTCALARACGLSVVGVSVDTKQELPRWLAGTQIPCVEIDLKHGRPTPI